MTSRVSRSFTRAIGGLFSPSGLDARLVVFCYHQVLEARDELHPDEPDRTEFTRDIETIGSVFNVLKLDEAIRRLSQGTLPARAACITFDDGYANNHEVAAPVLEAAGVPATFFVAAGAVDTGIMWNDLVVEAISRRRSTFVLDGGDELAERLGSLTPGWDLALSILNMLKYLPLDVRWARAERIYRANVDGEPPRLMMTREMVADLAGRGFDIGGHTVSHPILKELDNQRAQLEIESCSRWIADVTGVRPTSFAYPNGRPGKDFDASHEAMVEAAGFTLAVSTEWALAGRGSNVFAIPRVGPWWRQNRTMVGGTARAYMSDYIRRRLKVKRAH